MDRLFTLWGCGTGPLKGMHPSTKSLGGGLLLAGILIVPLQHAAGAALLVAATAGWCFFAGMPLRMATRLAAVASVFFLPLPLLAPWMGADNTVVQPLAEKFLHAATIVLRGACCLFITGATIAALPLAQLQPALSGLPLPHQVSHLILQIINQTMLLAAETFRIITVLRMRGASGKGALRVVFAFPEVWLGRMIFKAERVGTAMTVRGYDGCLPSAAREPAVFTKGDRMTLISAGAVFAGAIALRLAEFA